jgi:predicted DNA-binding protein (UPF0251 family)
MSAIELAGVLSGDIVKSSRKETSRQAIMDRLSLALEDSRTYLNEQGCLLYFSDIYRGDAFQCALTEPEYSLWMSVFIRTELIKLRAGGVRADVRLGLGLGAVSSWNEKKISSSDGEAFRLSGKALDSLKSRKDKYRRLRIISPWSDEAALLSVLASFLDALMQRWTPEQAEAISLFLRDTNQEEASKILKIRQPSVQRRLQTAGHFAVKEALELFSQIIKGRVIKPQLNNAGL